MVPFLFCFGSIMEPETDRITNRSERTRWIILKTSLMEDPNPACREIGSAPKRIMKTASVRINLDGHCIDCKITSPQIFVELVGGFDFRKGSWMGISFFSGSRQVDVSTAGEHDPVGQKRRSLAEMQGHLSADTFHEGGRPVHYDDIQIPGPLSQEPITNGTTDKVTPNLSLFQAMQNLSDSWFVLISLDELDQGLQGLNPKQNLAVFHRLCIFDGNFYNSTPDVGWDLIHNLHRLHDA